MLSPHELATLMLVRHAPDQIDMTRIELDTLLGCRLISFEPLSGGPSGELRRPALTPAGVSVLEAAARLARRWPPREQAASGEDSFA